MTDRKTQVLSNLLSLILGVGLGAGGYRVIEQINRVGEPTIEQTTSPPADGGGGNI